MNIRTTSSSLDKIVQTYFAAVTKKEFVYKKKTYTPRTLIVTPNIFRQDKCHENCGGCCHRVSSDWLPSEQYDVRAAKRSVEFDGKSVDIFEAHPDDTDERCHYLDPTTAHCKVHMNRPMHCDFELLRFVEFKDKFRLSVQHFGRGWNMKRICGNRGALCTLSEPTPAAIKDAHRRMLRLFEWTEHFGLDTWIPEILEFIEQGPQGLNLICDPVTNKTHTALYNKQNAPKRSSSVTQLKFF